MSEVLSVEVEKESISKREYARSRTKTEKDRENRHDLIDDVASAFYGFKDDEGEGKGKLVNHVSLPSSPQTRLHQPLTVRGGTPPVMSTDFLGSEPCHDSGAQCTLHTLLQALPRMAENPLCRREKHTMS